ncbi:TetR/AcrR family transcriptional regulator [Chryseobacterium sp. MYb264]|uniref:TetR/AcrR family transcriptional regulator n=1 Tax=Chryseobacterium sp. MYb264 TaxID=2745153 RepID=UPI002E0D4997|nr:TetR/AcrR family transcriptional regulator [Chryseobacterium sp. MYb264]
MAKKISVKERIVETATRLFYHQGFNSTGINQIIAEAGIAIGSLYKHFQSKEDLLCYYLQQQETEFFSNLNEYLKNEKNASKKILKMIDYRIDLQQKADFSGCHFIKINAEIGRQNQRIADIVSGHKQRQYDYIKTILSETESPENKSSAKEISARTIFLMIEGAVVSSSILGNTDDLKNVKKTVKELL